MRHGILALTFGLIIVPALVWLALYPVEVGSSKTVTQSMRFARCFQDKELSEGLATLRLQGGTDVAKVYESLLARTRTAPRCRTQLVQALISGLDQARKYSTLENGYHYLPNENYFLWEHGTSMLAQLKATEALDLLIANIDLNNGFPSSLDDFPAVVAILRIGVPAIPKLEIVLKDDSVPHRRKFAAFCIAYIGGVRAKRALTNALPSESDPCNKKFLQLSLQAFNNKAKPNHISSELNGKWLGAFYCL